MTKLREAGADMPRIHMTGLPQQCSACAGQDSSARHIDFEAECDRGWYGGQEGKIVMDDLILCEHCVKEGAAMLGLTEQDALKAQVQNLTSQLERAELDLTKAKKYADTLEQALTEQRDPPVELDHRKRPRPARAARDC